MRSIKYILAFCTLVLLFLFTSGIKSQTITISDASCMNGETVTDRSVIKVDMYKESFFYVRVDFPSAYGCNQISLKRFVLGNPNPVDVKDIDPSATSFCFEVYVIQEGDYVMTMYDCNYVEIGQKTVKVVSK
jgi:hypothetical protein